MSKIAILGGGSWGTALATVLADNGHDSLIWARNKDDVDSFNSSRENIKYLQGITLDNKIKYTSDPELAISQAEVVILAVGTQATRDIIEKFSGLINKDQIILNISKGIDSQNLMLISDIVKEMLPNNIYTTLSGPSHAEEVAKRIPTAVVVASENNKLANYVQTLFTNNAFRVYTNSDVKGVELGGSLKNIIAVAAGISDGVNCGDNTKAALMTRGIFEMSKLGLAWGARRDTFWGLSGIGDLIVTCTSVHSRNRKAGILIGQGNDLETTLKKIGMLVEGIRTTEAAYKLSQKLNIDMPITNEMYKVIYQGEKVSDSVTNLMGRAKKNEMESTV